MRPEVTVVGSGASGVHFALTMLRRGYFVRMVDVGHTRPPASHPDATLHELRRSHDDPADWFLGGQLEGLTLPGSEGEFYGFPPQKQFVFRRPAGVPEEVLEDFEPLFSYAKGGLAGSWTAGVYPFNEDDLKEFPFSYAELAPYYDEVANRIGVAGQCDDLERFIPLHAGLLEPLDLDPGSRSLLERYAAHKDVLNRRLGCYLGRSRLAVLSRDHADRSACTYLGRCLWGCPREALYTPDLTLRECSGHDSFEYESGWFVEAFDVDETRRARSLIVRPASGGPQSRIPVECLALAAGTLSTSRIYLESWFRMTGVRHVLPGLMDNRQVLVPFVQPRLLGRQYEESSYQYHQLSLGLEADRPAEYVHGQITTLTTAQAHPILQSLPVDLKTALYLFRNSRAALGLVNLNFCDRRRPECQVTLATGHEGQARLSIRYEPEAGEADRTRREVRRLRKVLRKLGCVVPPGLIHVRPMGSSVHYAGTLPMSQAERRGTTSPLGRSHDFENVYIVDGSTFPFLPAKNITFTLMANAIRIAENAFP